MSKTVGSQMAVRLSALRADHRFALQKYYFSAFGINICQRLSKFQGPVRPERLGKLVKIIHHVRS
jgi:hypothetical protein